jgi:hypothetical protein
VAAWLLRQQPIIDASQYRPQHDPNASSCDLRISQATSRQNQEAYAEIACLFVCEGSCANLSAGQMF